MRRQDLPKDFLEILDSVTNKRARFVIDTILEKGSCTTEDLKNGGYEHAKTIIFVLVFQQIFRALRSAHRGQLTRRWCLSP